MANGGQKTEPPTPKRLRDARRKGQVAKSQDLTMAVSFMAAALILAGLSGYIVEQLKDLMSEFFERATEMEVLDLEATASLFSRAGYSLVKTLAPLLGAMFVLVALVSFLQVGALFAFDPVKPQLQKLNPIQGFKRIFFSSRAYIELAKNILKMIVAAVLAYQLFVSSLGAIVLASRASLWQAATLAGDLALDLIVRVGVFFLAVGIGDFYLQKWLHLRDLRMTKEEVKREYKEEEGDPLIRSMRKQIHQEIALYDMIQQVKDADVIITNPTHIAVALKYKKDEMNAPRVMAKGERLIAEKILEIARIYDVPIVRNISLAQALNKLEIGEEIPEELYEAVAEVLVFVYSLTEERGA